MMETTPIIWVVFNVVILAFLALDLGIIHRKDKFITIKESALWSVFWLAITLAFNVFVYYYYGITKALEFLSGFVIERSLSVDNLFVFIMIFAYFDTPAKYQYKILFWGILGAMVMRTIFIFSGVILIEKFAWTLYVLGAVLIYTSIKMLVKNGEEDIGNNPTLKLIQKFIPVTRDYNSSNFFVIRNSKIFATPLLVVLLMIEISDIVFAIDSIPAIFSITLDPFIIYTSNVFAILGLRALFFFISGVTIKFENLKYGISSILALIGVKMLIKEWYEPPTLYTLITIVSILTVSILIPKRSKIA